jgi:phosphatidylserine/phosphatidylglycerophosphate/cardiolipin synthase-like enzyme
MTRFAFIVVLFSFANACAPEPTGFEEVEDQADVDPAGGKADTMAGPMVVVEIGDDFVELRNDGSQPVDLRDYMVSFSYRRVRLEPHAGRSYLVEPGALALVIDADAPLPARVPDATAVVDTSKDIVELLQYSKRLIVRTPDRFVTDRADGRAPSAPGATVERRLKTVWELSPIGGTAGVRNALRSDAIQTMFALPTAQSENPLPGAMAAWIDQADATLDGALYQIDHPAVIAALVRAAGRGVAIRIATDSHYLDDPDYAAGYSALTDAGIALIGDGRTARQHHKFLVRDGRSVWTGSYNPVLDEAGFTVADNAVTIESRSLAAAHTAEVDEMLGGAFGPHKQDGPGHGAFVDGAEVEVYFAPTDDAKQHILDAIRNAQHSIYFAQFSFYDEEIGAAMIERAEAGVDVRGVFDRRSANSITQYQPMVDAGLDVRRPYYDGLLHNKVVLVDYGGKDPIVITGSFNLTDKANTANDESVVMIHDPYAAREFYGMWRRLYDGCSGPNTDTTGQAAVAITEVFVEGAGKGFVELANLDSAPVDLSELALRDREGGAIALSGSLAGGARAAVQADALDLDYADALLVVDAQQRMLTTFDAPAYPGADRSLERAELAAPDLDAQWLPSELEGGTPGW